MPSVSSSFQSTCGLISIRRENNIIIYKRLNKLNRFHFAKIYNYIQSKLGCSADENPYDSGNAVLVLGLSEIAILLGSVIFVFGFEGRRPREMNVDCAWGLTFWICWTQRFCWSCWRYSVIEGRSSWNVFLLAVSFAGGACWSLCCLIIPVWLTNDAGVDCRRLRIVAAGCVSIFRSSSTFRRSITWAVSAFRSTASEISPRVRVSDRVTGLNNDVCYKLCVIGLIRLHRCFVEYQLFGIGFTNLTTWIT